MPPADRKAPVRAKSSDSRYSLMDFIGSCRTTTPASNTSGAPGTQKTASTPTAPKRGREGVEFKRYRTEQRRQT